MFFYIICPLSRTLFSFFLYQKGNMGWRRKRVIVTLLVVSPFFVDAFNSYLTSQGGLLYRWHAWLYSGRKAYFNFRIRYFQFFFLSMLSMERKLSEGGILITCRLFFNFRVKLNCVPGFTLMGNFLLQS